MGLRINTNVPALTALRTLSANDRNLQGNLERLSTGLRINSAADDPSGLVISEQLRAQVGSMRQALENSQHASNLIGTAEAAMNEVSDLLVQIRESVVFALNSGGNDDSQIDAEQDSIDNAIKSIDRIAQTTQFANRKLLDGSSGINVTSQAGAITNLDLQNIAFDGASVQQYTVGVTVVASQAALFSGASFAATSGGTTIIRLTGSEGTQDISIASGFGVTSFDDAVNIFTSDTGVFASGGVLYSVEFGSSESVSVEVVTGTLILGAGGAANISATSGVQTDSGANAQGFINGAAFDADGNDIRIVSDVLTGNISLADGTAAGAYTFTVSDSGLTFQLNKDEGVQDREQVGISSIHSSFLGSRARTINSLSTGGGTGTITVGGFLSSLVSGGSSDLDSDPRNALRIVDLAIDEVTKRRAHLGAFQSQTIDRNINALSIAVENLAASESSIRDLDFAQETSDFTKNQILYQSGISVLAQSNLISQSVLSLLG